VGLFLLEHSAGLALLGVAGGEVADEPCLFLSQLGEFSDRRRELLDLGGGICVCTRGARSRRRCGNLGAEFEQARGRALERLLSVRDL